MIEGVSANAGIVFTKTMEQLLVESLWQQRLWGVLLSIFGALAVLLAAIGIAYAVTERTREISFRVALGADGGTVLGLVLWRDLRLFAVGLTAGLIVVSLLYDVTPNDRATVVGVAGLLTAVTLVACYLPAPGGGEVMGH